jgi:F0F1-type ATP synthase assembly protein I
MSPPDCSHDWFADNWFADMAKPPDRPQNKAPSDPNSPSSQDSSPDDQDSAGWYRLSGIGLEFVVSIAVLGGAGMWLDRRLGSSPWFTVVGGMLGFATGMWMIIKSAKNMFR